MNRRKFLAASTAAGLSTAAYAQDSPKSSIYSLYYYYMRNGSQVERTTGYLRDVFAPAAKRNGIAPVGFFSPVFGDRAPYILSIATYPSFASIDTVHQKFADDKEFQKGWDAYNTIGDPAYNRIDVTVLRAFDRIPSMEVPGEAQRARTYELRTYESMNEKAGAKKIKMFEDGEAAIFKRLGMKTVFFGRTIAGRNLPSLVYLLGYDDMANREKLWGDFGRDPEWQKLRATPGLSDAEIVSNISSTILRPLPFSMIR
jgi:hypothetical protein